MELFRLEGGELIRQNNTALFKLVDGILVSQPEFSPLKKHNSPLKKSPLKASLTKDLEHQIKNQKLTLEPFSRVFPRQNIPAKQISQDTTEIELQDKIKSNTVKILK